MKEIAGAARHLPPIVTMPLNALRNYSWPPFYGGSTLTYRGGHALKVKLSLLGVQQVLTGEIEYAKFAADHEDVINAIKRVTSGGAMLSDVHIEHVPDRDDDWIELVFDRVAPDRLFSSRPEQSLWMRAITRIRSFLGRWS